MSEGKLKDHISVPSVDLFMDWERKLQGLDCRNQVMSEFLGVEINPEIAQQGHQRKVAVSKVREITRRTPVSSQSLNLGP